MASGNKPETNPSNNLGIPGEHLKQVHKCHTTYLGTYMIPCLVSVLPWFQQSQCSRSFLLRATDWWATWHRLVDCQWYDTRWVSEELKRVRGPQERQFVLTQQNLISRAVGSTSNYTEYSVWGLHIWRKVARCGLPFLTAEISDAKSAKRPITPMTQF